MNHELEATRTQSREAEKKQRKFDQQQAEYRANLQNAITERDNLEQGMRDQESKILSLGNEIAELQQRLEEAERTKRFLQQELDEQLSNKDDVGKNVHELEHINRQYAQENADLRTQIEELEDGLQLAEDNNLRLQVTLDSIKNDNERQGAIKDEEYEDKKRNLNKKIADLEDELENERRSKVAATAQKKKAETQLAALEQQLEEAYRQREEINKQLKRAQQQIATNLAEGEDIKVERDRMSKDLREAERRMREALGLF